MSTGFPPLPSAEQLLDEMPCGVLVTTTSGIILQVNGTFCRWVGHDASELVGKKKLQELLTVGARIFHQTHWLPMLQMQGSISEVKFDVRAKGGKTIPMLLNVIRRTTERGTCDEVSAVIAEERNKYERELLAARKRADGLVLREQDRALFAEQMIGIVSHDLRNPLTVVLMATKVLAEKGVELTAEKSNRLLTNITRAAERSQRLIADLLDFTAARVGQGLQVTRLPIDLHQVAEKAVEELSLAFTGRTLLHRHEGNGQVVADADRLAQLLGNLVANAMVYGDSVSPVTVTSSVDSDVAKLTVHNEGPAIPPELLAKVFEPMVRGGTIETSVRSVGLGLFIVRAIAAAHAGSVAVTSTSESGTEFFLTFPAHIEVHRT